MVKFSVVDKKTSLCVFSRISTILFQGMATTFHRLQRPWPNYADMGPSSSREMLFVIEPGINDLFVSVFVLPEEGRNLTDPSIVKCRKMAIGISSKPPIPNEILIVGDFHSYHSGRKSPYKAHNDLFCYRCVAALPSNVFIVLVVGTDHHGWRGVKPC